MRLVRLVTTVTEEHTVTVKVPEDVESGPVEMIVAFAPRDSNDVGASTLGDLSGSEFFGIWHDRDDVTDSSDFARALREQTWTRSQA